MLPHLKRKAISQCQTPTQLINEINKNKVDGDVMIRGVCAYCHLHITNEQRELDRVNFKPTKNRVIVNEFKRSLVKCHDPNCQLPEILCTEGNESFFHLDHLHGKKHSCEECIKNPSSKKVDDVGRLLNGSKEKLLAELKKEKVQLLHGVCHFALTLERIQNGESELTASVVQMIEEEMKNDSDDNDGDNEDEDNNNDAITMIAMMVRKK